MKNFDFNIFTFKNELCNSFVVVCDVVQATSPVYLFLIDTCMDEEDLQALKESVQVRMDGEEMWT